MIKCCLMTTTDFQEWLERELKSRGWRPADLSAASGIDSGTLTNVLNRNRNPGLHFCVRVAQAFHIPPEDVLRIAGILPPSPQQRREHDPLLNEAFYLVESLPATDLPFVLRILRSLVQQPAGTPSAPERPAASVTDEHFGFEQLYALMDLAGQQGTDAIVKMLDVLKRIVETRRAREEDEQRRQTGVTSDDHGGHN